MNKDAGRGSWLMVTVRLENGQKLPMVVDTGSPATCFDTNLATVLGKRLDTGTFWNFGRKHKIGVYAAPRLYWDGTPLKMTGTNVLAGNFISQLSPDAERPVMGILGMDVLGHYCLQLDFKRGKMRFLDDQRAVGKDWGKPFPLTDVGDG
ncbi:MAG: aspartyl protease family protein, partial [Verrucomicrobiota bacterium]|nr:aspartyl protease family protein [Verrucomicrobiota bacterium]